MKTNKVLVGMLACLGLTVGVNAACPPECASGSESHGKGQAFTFSVAGAPITQGFQQRFGQFLGAQPGAFVVDDCAPSTFTFVVDDDVDGACAFGGMPMTVEGFPSFNIEVDGMPIDMQAFPAMFEVALDDDAHQVFGQMLALNPNVDGHPLPGRFQQAFTVQPDGAKKTVRVLGSGAGQNDNSSSNIVIIEDGKKVVLKMENGKITSLERDGKSVPLDQVKRDGNKVKILDADGDVTFDFELDDTAVAGGPAQVRWQTTRDGAPSFTTTPDVMMYAEPPKAMIGVQLGEPDAMLAGHFGFEPGTATLITGVYDGLPAAKAGIRPYDIIVGVNGSKSAGQGELREALRSKDDGDRVTLTIIHKGERKEVKINLVKYDQNTLEKAQLDAVKQAASPTSFTTTGDHVLVAPDFTQFRNWQGQDPEAVRALAEEWAKKYEGRVREFTTVPDAPTTPRVPGGPGPGAAGTLRMTPGVPGGAGASDARWERIEDRLERLEKMIERLAEQRSEGGAKRNR